MPYLPDFHPQPASLRAAAARRARGRLDARLIELRTLASPLAMLDQEVPALAELGLAVDPDALGACRERVGSGDTLRSVLRLYTGGAFQDATLTQRWIDALVGLGFAYVSQDDAKTFPSVLLRKGLLHIRIDLPREQAAQTPAQQGAARSAA